MVVTKDLCKGKDMDCHATGGSYLKDTPYSAYDLQEPYLRLIFGFMGITDIEAINADNLMAGEETRSQDLAHAQAALQAAVSRESFPLMPNLRDRIR